MNYATRFLGTAFSVLLAAYVVPGFVVANFLTAATVAIILGVINVTIKPILKIVTFPLTVLTLGLFTFVLNAGLILLIASIVDGFTVNGFLPALFGGAVIAVVGWAVHKLI